MTGRKRRAPFGSGAEFGFQWMFHGWEILAAKAVEKRIAFAKQNTIVRKTVERYGTFQGMVDLQLKWFSDDLKPGGREQSWKRGRSNPRRNR